jgi:phenylacetate-CoA ligase
MTLRIHDPAVEHLSRAELAALQWRRLKETIEHAYANSGFWAGRFRAAGVTPDDITSVEAYRDLVPPVSKADLLDDQLQAEPYGRRLAVAENEIQGAYLTSGSSGQAQEVHAYTGDDLAAWSAGWGALLRWAGLEPGDVGYLMVPIGVTVGPVSMYRAFCDYGLQTFAVGGLDGEARLAMMRRFQPHFFSCGPIYLRRLTKLAQAAGIEPARDFPRLKVIKLGSYGYTPGWAQEMIEFWGAALADNYASTQLASGLAATCEAGVVRPDGTFAMMHVPEHRVLFEVVDPKTGRQVEEGETGEAVVTPFDRRATPLLRFRTGDRVRRLGHTFCTCGRPLAGVEAGTVTRYDTMLKIRGMNLWTEAIDDVVLNHPDVSEYNGTVYVNDLGREVAEIRVLLGDGADGSSETVLRELAEKVKHRTNVNCALTAGTPGTVRQIDYKERRWQDLRMETM